MSDYGVVEANKYPEGPVNPQQEPIRKRLQWKRDRMQKELEQIDGVLKMLDENPAFEQLHDALSRVHFGLGGL